MVAERGGRRPGLDEEKKEEQGQEKGGTNSPPLADNWPPAGCGGARRRRSPLRLRCGLQARLRGRRCQVAGCAMRAGGRKHRAGDN